MVQSLLVYPDKVDGYILDWFYGIVFSCIPVPLYTVEHSSRFKGTIDNLVYYVFVCVIAIFDQRGQCRFCFSYQSVGWLQLLPSLVLYRQFCLYYVLLEEAARSCPYVGRSLFCQYWQCRWCYLCLGWQFCVYFKYFVQILLLLRSWFVRRLAKFCGRLWHVYVYVDSVAFFKHTECFICFVNVRFFFGVVGVLH